MVIRKAILAAALAAGALLGGCREAARGPLVVTAIGEPPELRNPNLEPLDPPSALLVQSVAQGLVRFDAAGQIEPALAQSWIVSDDGLRYTFRIARRSWSNGRPVTAKQVAARLRAALSASSKNKLKPLLGAISNIEAMTENVLEISLKAPRPNFLQILAQPELGIIRNGEGTGPYQAEKQGSGSILLSLPDEDEQDQAAGDSTSEDIILRGDPAALAVARFKRGLADLVPGGTAGNLAIARAAAPRAGALRFDPVAGLFGLEFARDEGPLGDAAVRGALAMAINRQALAAALGVPGLQARETLVPTGLEELGTPAVADWGASPLPARREIAARAIAGLDTSPLKLRVAIPQGPGYRLVFAHLRRDWRAIGVDAEAVPAAADADLRLIDAVAPALLPSWYLRRFSCAQSAVCSPEADLLLEQARNSQAPAERQALLASADRILTDITAYIPLTAPVRWSLVSPRATGFQPNPFGRRFLGSLVAARR